MAYLRAVPEDANIIDVLARYPGTAPPLTAYHEALMAGEAPIGEADRALLAAFVSGLNSCQYCYGLYNRLAVAHGLDEELVADLLTDLDRAPVSAKLRALMRYAAKLTEEPEAINDSDAEAVYEAGWDDAALYYTVSICALVNMVDRLVEGLGLRTDPEHLDRLAERVHERGFEAILRDGGAAG